MRKQKHPNPADGDERGGAFNSPLIHRTDLWLALVILAGCAALYYATTRFEEVSALMAQNIPPEYFPRLLIWTIVVLTVLLPFEHLFLRTRKKYWLIPVLLMMALFGALLVFAQGSAIAPFIYTIF